jgi:hypothetical protein
MSEQYTSSIFGADEPLYIQPLETGIRLSPDLDENMVDDLDLGQKCEIEHVLSTG